MDSHRGRIKNYNNPLDDLNAKGHRDRHRRKQERRDRMNDLKTKSMTGQDLGLASQGYVDYSDYIKAEDNIDVKRLNRDYDEVNNGVFHQTLFLPNKG